MTEKELNEQKKEYLNSYKNLCRKLRSLEEQMNSLREIEESAKIQELSYMPKGSKQNDLSNYMAKLDELERKIQCKRQECIEKKFEIERSIANVKNGEESMVLYSRYIKLTHWDQICVEMSYSKMQIHRIHNRALHNIKI